MHNLVVAEYIVRSGFLSSGSPTCTFGFHDEMPKSTAFRRSGMYGNPCWSVRINNSQGIYNTTTDRADPSDPASGQRGPIRPCQIRIAVLDRLALLSVRTSRDASLDTGGGQTLRQIHKDDRSCSFVPESLQMRYNQEKSGCM